MPLHMVELVEKALIASERTISSARVVVLGYAYLEDSDDMRNSPSIVLVKRLRELGTEVVIHDPYIAGYKGDLLTLAMNADAIVVMVAHHNYKMVKLSEISAVMRTPLLIDGRSVYTREQAEQAGLKYIGLGKG